jgi:hypothetical protein
MTASYPMVDACRNVVASGATLRAQTAPLGKPGTRPPTAHPSRATWPARTSVFTGPPPTAGEDAPAIQRSGHLRSQRVGGGPRPLPQAQLREASANPLWSWAVAASRHVSSFDRLRLGK